MIAYKGEVAEMGKQLPRAGFTDVDREAEPELYVRCLEYQNDSAFKQAYKQRTFALLDLQPGHCILDVGCGLGQDVLEMAGIVGPTGEVVGLDFSGTMIEQARERSRDAGLAVTFHRGDVHNLEYGDDSFDRCRADRTFQHLPDPRRALEEMIRVTKPGGRLLIVDPDHETMVIDTPYKDVTRRFLAFRSDGLAQGGIAHHLYRMFKELGLEDVTVEGLANVSTDYETAKVFRYVEGMRTAQEHGVVTQEEADQWIEYLEQAGRDGRFFSSNTYFITTGRKST